MLGLADLLAKNDAGALDRPAPFETTSGSLLTAPRVAGSGGEDRSARVLPRPGLVLDGKRQLTRLLGAGSFGAVYEARQLDLDRLEAVKLLHERWMDDAHHDVRTRFLDEARMMARMRGPHLVAVHDWGTLPGGLPYFVMERLEGETLRARQRARGPLPLHEFFDVAAQILEGLCEAHAHGVVHRDVKPENIFLTEGGIKLLDFGLAKSSVTASASDAAMGTPLYMAPETITRPGCTDARTDLYAAAVVMYEMLAGRVPLRRPAGDLRALEHEVLHGRPAPLADHRQGLPAGLDALVQAGLSKHPDDRPRTARDMLARLLEIRDRHYGAARAEPGLDDEPPVCAVTRTGSIERTSRSLAIEAHHACACSPAPWRWAAGAVVALVVMIGMLGMLGLGWLGGLQERLARDAVQGVPSPPASCQDPACLAHERGLAAEATALAGAWPSTHRPERFQCPAP